MLPESVYQENSRAVRISGFKGINRTNTAADGELAACGNLSSDAYPFLSPRKGRASLTEYSDVSSVFSWDKLVAVSGGTLYYDGEAVGNVTSGEKQFAVINTKLVIWPDKTYLDIDSKEYSSLEAETTSLAETAVFGKGSLTFQSQYNVKQASNTENWGYSYLPYRVSDYFRQYTKLAWTAEGGWTKTPAAGTMKSIAEMHTPGVMFIPTVTVSSLGTLVFNTTAWSPALAENEEGYYAVVTAVTSNITMVAGQFEFVPVGDTSFTYDVYKYGDLNNTFTGLFFPGDSVEISGSSIEANNITAIIREVSDYKLVFDDGIFTVGTSETAVTIRRSLPELAYICESDNRLWGVSNTGGEVYNSETEEFEDAGHCIIYASALGDPKNFFVYDGLSTDSYAVAVASKGDFQGIIAYSGSVLCFKEDILHRVTGSMPSDYYLYDYTINGLQPGACKSMQIINEVLYYKGREGIYSWSDGSLSLVSYDLGFDAVGSGAAGTDGVRYYISLRDDADEWSLYVYDTMHGLWLRQDETGAAAFTCFEGVMYMVSDGQLLTLGTGGYDGVEWSAELAACREDTAEKKDYKWLRLSAEGAAGSRLKVEVKKDRGEWVTRFDGGAEGLLAMNIPLAPCRCSEFMVRLSGQGRVTVMSLEREFHLGSEF